MEIKTETTEQDHLNFYKEYGLKRNWTRKALIMLLINLILCTYLPLGRHEWLLLIIIFSIILSPFFFLIPYLLIKTKFKRVYKNNLSALSKTIYKPFAIGIEILNAAGETFVKYENIRKTGRTRNYVFLILSDGDYYLLPNLNFSSYPEIDHFLAIIGNGLTNEKTEPAIRFKSYYLWGLLGLIPGIGLIAGIVIIGRALFILRDFMFAIIGAAGIAITIFFYYQLAHSP